MHIRSQSLRLPGMPAGEEYEDSLIRWNIGQEGEDLVSALNVSPERFSEEIDLAARHS
jgi:hypothetical protein